MLCHDICSMHSVLCMQCGLTSVMTWACVWTTGEQSEHKSDVGDADAVSSASRHSSRSSSRRSSRADTDDDDRDGYLSPSPVPSPAELKPQLPPYFPALQGCRNVEEFQCLNRIEEGTYGVVYRAVDRKTGTLPCQSNSHN